MQSTETNLISLIGVAINRLLTAFELPTGGRVNEKKNRFRQYIGLTVL